MDKTYLMEDEWDGTCPECGGSHFGVYPWDNDGETIPSMDRDVPPTFKTYWEEWKCEDCGHIVHLCINEPPDDDVFDEDRLMERKYN